MLPAPILKLMRGYVSARERATLVDALLAMQVAILGLRTVGWVVIAVGWPHGGEGGGTLGELARTAAHGAQLSEPITWMLFSATAFAFCVWLHRALTNLRVLGMSSCLVPELAWLALLSPLFSLVAFPRVVWRVWLASDPTPPPAGRVHGWMAAWWPTLLVSLAIGCARLPRSWRLPADDAVWLALGEGLRVMSAVACMRIVRDVQRRQDEQWADRQRRRAAAALVPDDRLR